MGNIEEIKLKYIRKESSQEEDQVLFQWLKDHPEERKEFYQKKDIWDSYDLVKDSKNYSPEIESRKLHKRIRKAKQTKLVVLPYIKVAAVFVFAFVSSWLIQSQYLNQEQLAHEVEMREVFVPKGQINQIFLADGSRIWLNSESSIEIPSIFTDDERVVKLRGEAFFEVAKDAKHPFKVKVEGQTIEVLGTSFNVRAYPNSSVIQTTLNTGKITLQTKKGKLAISPGEQTELDKATGDLTLKKVNPSNFDSWKEGRYEFVDEDLIEVFKVVERWYDVELIYSKEDFELMNFSGVIKRNNSIQHFLTLLGYSIPINYEINMEKVKISKVKEAKQTKN